MKRLTLFILSYLLFTVGANAFVYVYIPDFITDVNNHEQNSRDITIEVLKVNNSLKVIFHNVPGKEWEKLFLPESGADTEGLAKSWHFRYGIDEKDKTIFFDRDTFYPISSYLPDYSSVIYDVGYTIPDAPDGEWTLIGDVSSYTPDAGMIELGFKDIVTLSDGARYIMRPLDNDRFNPNYNVCFYSHFYRHEWVVCNDSEGSGTRQFFRLRFKGEPIKESIDGGKESIYMYPLMMSTSEKYDEETAMIIAYMGVSCDKTTYVKATDADIPSAFWGSGISAATVNPTHWRNFKDGNSPVKVYEFGSPSTDDFQYYNFTTDRYVYGFKHNGGDAQTCFGEMMKINVSPSADSESEPQNERWHGEWINGLGAVGDWYASNLPYPIYDFPEGITPSYLLYVRDIVSNEVLWGNPEKDPGYMGTGEIFDDESVNSSKEGVTKYYNLQGIEEKNPIKGIFIRIENGEAEKILIGE